MSSGRAAPVQVLPGGGAATVRGTVDSWPEHAVVQQPAGSAPGIPRALNRPKVLA